MNPTDIDKKKSYCLHCKITLPLSTFYRNHYNGRCQSKRFLPAAEHHYQSFEVPSQEQNGFEQRETIEKELEAESSNSRGTFVRFFRFARLFWSKHLLYIFGKLRDRGMEPT